MMRFTNRTHRGISRNLRGRRAQMFAAVGAVMLGGSALGQVATLYFDSNGTASGLGTAAGTWNATNVNWATSTGGTTVGTWVSGDIASFNSTAVVNVSGVQSVGGLLFTAGGGNGIQVGVTGAAPWALDFGTDPFTIGTTGANKHVIAVPIRGSGDMTISNTGTAANPIDLAGDLSQFTGNIYVNADSTATISAANGTQLQLDSAPGNPNATIYMDQWTALANNNQISGAGTAGGVATPLNYAIPNNVVLNYKGLVSNVTNTLSSSNGLSGTSIFGNATFVSGTEKIVTFSGVISSSTVPGIVTNVNLSGPRGTIVLANHMTWNGNTTVALGGGTAGNIDGNGLLQMGIDNALPATTVLTFGSGASSTAPMDLNGYNLAIAGLATGTTITTDNGTNGVNNGNIYNTGMDATVPADVTLTIAGAANTTFGGDIGATSVNVNPFNDNAPFVTGRASDGSAVQHVHAYTNISLVVNGPGALTLAPPTNQRNGNEYTGTTTVNGGTLALGRTATFVTGNAPGSLYTLMGGGTVTVNSGGTLASIPTNATTYAGGASGNIVLNAGATLNPGGTGTTGILSTNGMNVNAGSNLNFDFGANSSLFDFLYLNGGLTLDPAGTSTVKLGLSSGVSFVSPGTYTLINANGGISMGAGLTLDASAMPGGETFTPQFAGNLYQIVITAPAVQWDPHGDGAARLLGSPSQTPTEDSGTWTDGASTFVNYGTTPVTEYTWSNADAKDVIIGNDLAQGGGTISLGSNIVAGKITFGAIFPGFNYTIAASGSNTLTIRGGISIGNSAASSTTPSAEIDAPVILGADQSWDVPSGQFLDIKGSLTGNFVMTKTGAGVVDLESGGGSIGGLTVNGGTVLLGAADSIGTSSPITLNGGGVQFSVDGVPSNPIVLGAAGGSIGATNAPGGGAPFNVTLTGNITGGAPLTAIGSGNTTFNGDIIASTFTSSTSTTVGGGVVTLNGSNTFGTVSVTGGTLNLNAANTISTSITIANATLEAASQEALGGPATPINLFANGVLAVPGFSTLGNPINFGTNGSSSMTISDTVPLTLAGIITGNGNVRLVGPEFTLSGNNTNGNSVDFETEGQTIHATSATAFGNATIAVDASSTLDAQVDVSTNAIRSSVTAATLTKVGPGTLTINAAASVATVAGSAFVLNEGTVVTKSYLSLGGTTSSSIDLNLTLNPGTNLVLAWTTNTTRTSGAVTLNDATVTHTSVNDALGMSITAENSFTAAAGAAGAADVWTINGNSTIRDSVELTANNNQILGFTNPIVVTSGSTLTLDTQQTGGFGGNNAIDFRGPTVLTGTSANAYDTFLIRAGATVQQLGAGELRFGRVSSQGIPIIGQGTPGSESVLKLSTDTWMTDNANPVITQLVVNGSGTAGLRIEAPMNAVYVDPATSPDASMAIGTTGLFGSDPFAGQPNHTAGNVFTVLSLKRAAALSSSYSDGTNNYMPSGTLTLAANDAGGATGVVNAGPAVAAAVGLALDNTAASGNLVYKLDGQAANGANLLNFGNGVTIQRSNASAGTVVGALQSATHLSNLTLLDGTTFDLVNHALGVESSANTAGYLVSHALFSSAVDADAQGITTIAIVQGSDLGGITNIAGLGGITASTTIYDPTYYGDANLDGRVNADDYALVDRAFAKGLSPIWIDGDFNKNGTLDSGDYLLLDKAFAITNGATFSPGFLAQREAQFGPEYVSSLIASVPEPSVVLVSAMGLLLSHARRRRR